MAQTRFFKVKVITARSKVKSRSHYDEAQLHILTNVPTKYERPKPYGFRVMARARFFNVKVITAWSNQGQTMTRHNYTPLPMFLPNMNFLHLTVSEIWPGQDFQGQGHYSKVKGQIKVKL